MKRELKFRAWDGEEMLYEFSVQSNGDGVLYCGELTEWEIMQFTGLTDKNRVEIYEGDIVKCTPTDLYPNEEGISDIIFSGDFQWAVRMKHPDFPDNDFNHGLPVHWGGWKSLEVIGNIYEHAYLLNKTETA